MTSNTRVSMKHLSVLGAEHLPAGGGFMILPARLAVHELLRLEQWLAGRRIVYLVEQGARLSQAVRAHLESASVSAMSFEPSATDDRAYRQAVQAAAAEGAVVVYVPEECASLVAPVTAVPGVHLDFLLKAGVPVVPLQVHRPKEVGLPVGRSHADDDCVFAFAPALTGERVTLAAYQEALFALTEQCFSSEPALGGTLQHALIQGFKKHGGRCRLIDGKDGQELTFDKLFAAALSLSRLIRKETNKRRVGVILPPGAAGLIANVAVLLAGKTPVNLNFTASRAAIESSIRQGEIDKFLTADLLVRKMQVFPWPPSKQLILLERIFPEIKNRTKLWFVLSKLLPSSLLAVLLGLPKRGGRDEASLIFTSGSSGEPKGVILSHRNLLANVAQFGSRLALKNNDRLLACLPLFHSFGCTVTLWYPIIFGVDMVTYPTPLETKKLAELIEKHNVTVMIATPTFLRGYLRGVHREQLGSLRLVVTGAEKLPNTVAEAFEARFGKRVLEGYGLTETSPVSNVNLPDPEPSGEDDDGRPWLPACRMGSVGQLMPGLAIRITDPESGTPRPLHQSGMIWFKGANIFEGYLKDAKRTADALTDDGWFRTGDIGRVDLDGFLYIEGRLSRFSKIGGEMVPHETVEETLIKAMGLENESVRRIAVVGVPDPGKGEALVLLSALPGGPDHQEILDLRYRLLERGVPALWIPKTMIRVSDIPVLASGKLDVQACEKIARG